MKISSIASSGSGTQLSGVFLTKDNCPLSVYTLSWEKPTIFKPYQEVRDGQVQPWLDPNDPDSITNWVYIIPNVVRAAGTVRKVTFCTDIPKAEEGIYTESPFARFTRVIKDLSKQDGYKAHLAPLFTGGAGAGAPIPKIRKIGVMQGCLYMHNGKDMTQNPRPNVLLALTPSATDSLANLLTIRDPNGNAVVGDVFSQSPIKLFHFSKSTDGLLLPQGWQNLAENPVAAPQPGQMQTANHSCRMVQAPANVPVAGVGMNVQNWQAWDNILTTKSVLEQINIIAGAYDPYLSNLAFSNSEFEEMLPAFVRRPGLVISAPTAPPQQQNSMMGNYQQQQNPGFNQQPQFQPQMQQGFQHPPQVQNGFQQQAPVQNRAPFAMPLGASQEDDVDNAGTVQPQAAVATTLPPAGAVNQASMEASKARIQNMMNSRPQASGFTTNK